MALSKLLLLTLTALAAALPVEKDSRAVDDAFIDNKLRPFVYNTEEKRGSDEFIDNKLRPFVYHAKEKRESEEFIDNKVKPFVYHV